MFFLEECYHNKKLISTNCSKITQKLSPCSAPGELFFFSIASACLGFSCSSCSLRPLMVKEWPASLGLHDHSQATVFESKSHVSKTCVLKSV